MTPKIPATVGAMSSTTRRTSTFIQEATVAQLGDGIVHGGLRERGL